MNEVEQPTGLRSFRGTLLGVVLLAIVLGGAVIARLVSPKPPPSRGQSVASPQSRPIVQIVRQQPGLPDVADLVDRLCPSVATIVPSGSAPPAGDGSAKQVPASAYSSDGWLITSAANLPPMPLDAVFADGRRSSLADLRTDPVSGLAIAKADAASVPLALSDQAFPRVGQFGLVLTTPAGTGCSAASAMIGSDFIADGGSAEGYVRLRPVPDNWAAGMPVIGADGRVLGIGTDSESGEIIPAPIARVIIDELIRNSLSASASFGLRAVDYAPVFASRLGDIRSGAGIALVQNGSSAEKAGLQAGDIVTAVDDHPVSSSSELSRLLDAETGKARLTVQRRSGQVQITIKRNPGS